MKHYLILIADTDEFTPFCNGLDGRVEDFKTYSLQKMPAADFTYKGIAVTAGMIVAFLDWRLMIVCLMCFLIPLLISHTVSLGSLVLYAGFLVGMIIFGQLGSYDLPGPVLIEMYIVTALLAALAYWRHRGNIARLAAGQERKMF